MRRAPRTTEEKEEEKAFIERAIAFLDKEKERLNRQSPVIDDEEQIS